MLTKIDDLLNSITMYRLVLYCLCILVVAALGENFLGFLHFSIFTLAASLTLLLSVGFAANFLFAKIYGVAQNYESGLISTLILFFILSPPTQTLEWLVLVIAVVVMIASKYVITWRGAHIFNPVAFAAAILSLTGLGLAGWWIATPSMFLFVTICGLLILRKTRRFTLFLSFFLPVVLLLLLRGISIDTALVSFPIIFMGTIMLVEPATSPNTNRWRLVYGVLVGILFGAGWGVLSSPHIALLIGNVLAFAVSFRVATKLKLISKSKIANNTYDFAFEPQRNISFFPGQYMEWTLPITKFNARGNRRTFTIASSPLNKQVHIGIKFYQPSSLFKEYLAKLQPGEYIYGSHVAGDFVLPSNKKTNLTFVAGGIGITPFIAMLEHLLKTKQSRNITIFYFVNSKQEIAYENILNRAKDNGVKVEVIVGSKKRLDENILKTLDTDYQKRSYFISGPPAMVRGYKRSLKQLGIKKIQTDLFAGY